MLVLRLSILVLGGMRPGFVSKTSAFIIHLSMTKLSSDTNLHLLNNWLATIATSVPRGAFSWVTKKLRDENIVSIPLCATNRINAPTTAESILANGCSDLVSMARYVGKSFYF